MNADVLILFWLPFCLMSAIHCYDGYTTCSKPFRNSRAWSDLPCDFKGQNWCIIPGSVYPWHAVRRFVFENHGLMKRMYGEQRHISVLRAEIDSNDVDYTNDGWHGYHETTYKKYDKPHPTLLRQSFPSIYTTASTTTIPTISVAKTTPPNDNSTEMDETYVTEEEEDITTTDDDLRYETSTTPVELPVPSSTISSTTTTTTTTATLDSIRSPQPQMYQEPTSEMPTARVKGINACPVKEEVVAPFWANNTRGEILALLNLYPFEQYVHWERCTYENKQMYCRHGCRCEQQYRLHRLLAYDPTNDCRGIFSDWFKFPSCCVCKCYDIPTEFRQTSRSPRGRDQKISLPAGWNN